MVVGVATVGGQEGKQVIPHVRCYLLVQASTTLTGRPTTTYEDVSINGT